MSADNPALVRRMRRAGALVTLGLVVEIASSYWAHPTAFLFFAFGGALAVAAGIYTYLWAIARA